jgi:hypothetical protein
VRKWTVIPAITLMVMGTTLGAGATTGATVDDDPNWLPGFCYLITPDDDTELAWVMTFHDPESSCLDFAFDGREIDIAKHGEGLVWNVVGFDEGEIFALQGLVESTIFTYDSEAVAAGTPIFEFLVPENLLAFGDIDVNMSIVGTQAEGDGINIAHITVGAQGTVTAVDGSQARFTAAVHEEVAALLPGLTPTKVLSQLRLRPIG